MYKCMIDNLNSIEKIYSESGNHLVCLEGKKGTGKTTVLQEFINKHKNILQIESLSTCNNYLDPIINGLLQYYYAVKNEPWSHSGCSEFTYEECLLEQVLNICTSSKCAIVFYNYSDYSYEFIQFMQKSISAILRNGYSCSIFIEMDSDDDALLSKIQMIYKFHNLQHIYFPEIKADELRKVFMDEHPALQIAEKDINYIVSSANNNPALMNIIVNFLKAKKHIAFYEGNYFCEPLQPGTLSDVLKEDFLSRFDCLDTFMKATFLKSSMLGMEFRASHLANSFEIISADETLHKIEKISNLLFRKESSCNLYSFSNSETLYFAENMITDKQKTDWGSILYNYYRKLWESSVNNYDLSPENFAVRVAFYAVTLKKYQEATAFYTSAVFLFMKRNNYQQALIILKEIEKLHSSKELPVLVQIRLMEFRASCYENLGQYQKACDAYRDTIKNFGDIPYFDLLDAKYHLAYCTYYTSLVDPAIRLVETVKNTLDAESDTRKDALYYKVVSLLATLYREKSDPQFREMFLLAINECKDRSFEYDYYVQLRKADLCYEIEFAIPMLQKAVTYFKKNDYKKEYGKATHNLGIDFLYIGDINQSICYIEESQKIFAMFGSVDEVYSINCLGVWHAIVKNDYEQALELFRTAEQMPINDFKKMTVYANIIACYQKMHLYDKCEEYICKCNQLPAYNQNKDIGFYQRTIPIARAFYYMEQKQYFSSLECFRSCWKVPVKNDQAYLIAVNSLNLCSILNIKPIKEELQFSLISHSNLYEKYYKTGCIFHTLRFIE